jgi:hypothetical protein
MNQSTMYKRHRFPPEIIQYAVWLQHRFNLGRHFVSAKTYKLFRLRAFESWEKAAAISNANSAVFLTPLEDGSRHTHFLRYLAE